MHSWVVGDSSGAVESGSIVYVYTEVEDLRGALMDNPSLYSRVAFASFLKYTVRGIRSNGVYKVEDDGGSTIIISAQWEIKTNILVDGTCHRFVRVFK